MLQIFPDYGVHTGGSTQVARHFAQRQTAVAYLEVGDLGIGAVEP